MLALTPHFDGLPSVRQMEHEAGWHSGHRRGLRQNKHAGYRVRVVSPSQPARSREREVGGTRVNRAAGEGDAGEFPVRRALTGGISDWRLSMPARRVVV